MKKLFWMLALLYSSNAVAQKVYTKNGNVSFFSKTPLEDISADNNQVTAVFNQQTGDLQFSLLIKSFHFKKALMEEHFNENYMESGKFPKAVFKGKLNNLGAVDFTKDGSYPVIVTGDLSIHGITKNVSVPGRIVIQGSVISTSGSFNVTPGDYGIKIPRLVRDNIAQNINITVNCMYTQKM